MIKTTSMLYDELTNYVNPNAKIKRMVDSKQLIPITRGIYETDETVPGQCLASVIYGPSYISFEYALSYYSLIPEAVYNFTCACFEKKRKKHYSNAFGTFTYRDVSSKAYPYYIDIKKEKGYSFQIASPEKAVCDMLYKVSPLGTVKGLRDYLFDDLRIDSSEFARLNYTVLEELCPLYSSTNHKLLLSYIKRNGKEAYCIG